MMNDEILIWVEESEWRGMLFESRSLGKHPDPFSTPSLLARSKELAEKRTQLRYPPRYYVLQKEFRNRLLEALDGVARGDMTDTVLARYLFKEYFEEAYALGLRSSGVGKSARSNRQILSAHDRAFIDNAVREEMSYFLRYAQKVQQEGKETPWRSMMYAKGLAGMYGAGRIAGLPQNALLWWTGPNDEHSCESCRYLHHNNPYTTLTLPTTPRAGHTRCLTNCRDVIVARAATDEEVSRVLDEGKTKIHHVAILDSLMANRKLKAPI